MDDPTPQIDTLTRQIEAAWSTDLADELASLLAARGGTLANGGRMPDALEDFERSVALFRRAVEQEGRADLAPKLALARLNRGITRCNTGRLDAGVQDFDAAIAIYEERATGDDGDVADLLALAQRNRQIAQQHLARMRGGPMYDPNAVLPMREDLTRVGVEELLSAQDVEAALSGTEGTTLLVINSVCGCAAGSARPGVMLALQNKTIPDRLTTVFAGMEREAVERARGFLAEFPPSSPFVALFKGGQVVTALQRGDIEGRSAVEIATRLAGAFDEHCSRPGPSIPREDFERLETPKHACGSSVPPFLG